MFLEISTELGCSPERAWQEVQTTRLLEYVTRPLLIFEPIEPQVWPKIWKEGKYLVKMKFLGIMPFAKQWIDISILDTSAEKQVYQIRDNGHGDLVNKWDHLIIIEETPTGKTKYIDRLEIDAGILTLLVWLYANIFYRHRQKRWQKLVKNDFDYSNSNRG
ncbi:MAG: hypothetical protein AB4368_28410 [Xenococcaceae cyanobacterium]